MLLPKCHLKTFRSPRRPIKTIPARCEQWHKQVLRWPPSHRRGLAFFFLKKKVMNISFGVTGGVWWDFPACWKSLPHADKSYFSGFVFRSVCSDSSVTFGQTFGIQTGNSAWNFSFFSLSCLLEWFEFKKYFDTHKIKACNVHSNQQQYNRRLTSGSACWTHNYCSLNSMQNDSWQVPVCERELHSFRHGNQKR